MRFGVGKLGLYWTESRLVEVNRTICECVYRPVVVETKPGAGALNARVFDNGGNNHSACPLRRASGPRQPGPQRFCPSTILPTSPRTFRRRAGSRATVGVVVAATATERGLGHGLHPRLLARTNRANNVWTDRSKRSAAVQIDALGYRPHAPARRRATCGATAEASSDRSLPGQGSRSYIRPLSWRCCCRSRSCLYVSGGIVTSNSIRRDGATGYWAASWILSDA